MARKPLVARYRVDSVPLLLRPFHNALSYSFGVVLYAYARLIHATARIVMVGQDRIQEDPNHIFCLWHKFTPVYFCVFPRHSKHAWMQYPAWLVKHVHIVVRLVGVEKLVFGSTGHGGRAAAESIVEYLKRGYSTVLMPDGPRGPAMVLKDGAFHISQQSGVPIVPLRFVISRYIRARDWDRKEWPLPFSTIRVEFGAPVHVTERTFEDAKALVSNALGTPVEGSSSPRDTGKPEGLRT
jgi:lysophospholipid acyltransferase (LPLAT)-like uncharacterized protein